MVAALGPKRAVGRFELLTLTQILVPSDGRGTTSSSVEDSSSVEEGLELGSGGAAPPVTSNV